MTEMRTKRRYAHELYPHPAEDETRPLSVEVPYLYARALGYALDGTGWTEAPREVSSTRVSELINVRRIALLADALLQGMSGDEAWREADQVLWDESGEVVSDRATYYGVPWKQIKPYPCGPEPDIHWHYTDTSELTRMSTESVRCRESECPDCCEPVTER